MELGMTGKLDEISYMLGQIDSKLNSLTLDVKEDRAVQTQDRADLRTKFNSIDERMEKVESVCDQVAAMQPTVDEFKTLKSKIAAAVVTVGAIVSGALYLIWQGVGYVGPYVRDFIDNLLRK
jgi:hypothetical protein